MKELYIPSTDEKNKLHVVIWEPDIQVIGVVQISHDITKWSDLENVRYFYNFFKKNEKEFRKEI